MSILRQSLQQSGFANVTTTPTHVRYFPCPTGTFVNAAIKDWSSCERCPPGKFLPCDLPLVNVPSSISLSLFLKFQTLVFVVVVVVVVFFNMYSCLYSLIYWSILIVLSIRPFPSLFFDRPVQQPLRLLIVYVRYCFFYFQLNYLLLTPSNLVIDRLKAFVFPPLAINLFSVMIQASPVTSFPLTPCYSSSSIYFLYQERVRLTFFRNKNKWNTLRK